MRYKLYYFNDGLDGIVRAKSLSQAVNILRRNGYNCFSRQEIMKGIKTGSCKGNMWFVGMFPSKVKHSRVVGWSE